MSGHPISYLQTENGMNVSFLQTGSELHTAPNEIPKGRVFKLECKCAQDTATPERGKLVTEIPLDARCGILEVNPTIKEASDWGGNHWLIRDPAKLRTNMGNPLAYRWADGE